MSEALLTSMETAFTAVKSDVTTIIGKALPAGLAILSITLAIKIGMRFFKSVSQG